MAYVKLDTSILDSSIWCESSDTCKVWITMLAMADQDGLVASTAPGIARRAGLSLETTRQALEILESPDPESKTPDNEGRRIERISGGYTLLNYCLYRKKDHTNAERQKRHRDREKERNAVTPLREPLRNTCFASASASVSASDTLKKIHHPKKDIDALSEHILAVLKFPMSDKDKTASLLKEIGLEEMKAAVDRMGRYFAAVKDGGWKRYVIGHHWRNLCERISYFTSDDALEAKLQELARANAESKPARSSAHVGERPLPREAEVEAAAAQALEAEPEPKTDQQRLEELRLGREAMQPWDARRESFDREIKRLENSIRGT